MQDSWLAMAGELVVTTAGSDATPALSQLRRCRAGEREHLQQVVLPNLPMLGEDAGIVSFEFDRWLAGTCESTATPRRPHVGPQPPAGSSPRSGATAPASASRRCITRQWSAASAWTPSPRCMPRTTAANTSRASRFWHSCGERRL